MSITVVEEMVQDNFKVVLTDEVRYEVYRDENWTCMWHSRVKLYKNEELVGHWANIFKNQYSIANGKEVVNQGCGGMDKVLKIYFVTETKNFYYIEVSATEPVTGGRNGILIDKRDRYHGGYLVRTSDIRFYAENKPELNEILTVIKKWLDNQASARSKETATK